MKIDQSKYKCAHPTEKQMDDMLAVLHNKKDEWARLELEKKIHLLKNAIKRIGEISDDWVETACRAKGIDPQKAIANEEWLSGPFNLVFTLDQLIISLDNLRNGKPTYGDNKQFRVRADGQTIFEVFPHKFIYGLLLNGVKAEVWMQPGINRDNIRENTAAFYKQKDPIGEVTAIMGAGNIASIPSLDILHVLFEEGNVGILKMNPVNEYLGPFFKYAFEDFVKAGYLEIICGDAEIGSYLTHHPNIDTVHMTGSEVTFNTIVFGQGKEGEENRRKQKPGFNKKITAELGGVTPSIVVPGPWSKADIRFQAENLLIQKFFNAGNNCISSQIIITPEHWEKTDPLLNHLKHLLLDKKERPVYYPGAAESVRRLQEAHPIHETFGGEVPVTMVNNLDHTDKNDYCFNTEFFGMLWGQTSIPGESPEAYLQNVIEFCNGTLAGSLGANIIIHPQTIKALGSKFEDLLANLKYGSIGVNIWSGAGFLLTQTSWGAFPGNDIYNAGSGIGHVHNALLFDKPEKSIVYAPFHPFPRGLRHGYFNLFPKPPWFLTHKNGHKVAQRMTRYSVDGKLSHLPGIFYYALKG